MSNLVWARDQELQNTLNRIAYEAMTMTTAIIIPPYFDGPVFNDDYGVEVAKVEEPIEFPKSAKVPELPVEVYHTQPFNASAAWEAVRALSRGA